MKAKKSMKTRERKGQKHSLRKVIVGTLLIFCSFVTTMIYALAGEKPVIEVSSINAASRGDVVKFNISLKNKEEYNGINFNLSYDSSKLEYVKSSTNLSGSYDLRSVIDKGNGELSVTFGLADGFYNGDIDLGEIAFRVLDDASGNYDITLSDAKLMYANRVDVQKDTPVEVVNGKVFVKVPAGEVSLKESNFELDLGSKTANTASIVVNYNQDTTESREFTYVSSDTSIVEVDASGKLVAKGAGDTTVKVTAFGEEFVANVKVVSHITGISLDKDSLSMSKGGSEMITARVTPEGTTDSKVVTWKSSNESVVTVNDGVVTAIGGGSATVTATSSNGLVATCTVEVVVPITNATISDTTLNLDRSSKDNNAHKLVVTVTPGDASDQDVTWSSSKPEVATVDQEGNVKAVSTGSAVITAKVGSFTLETTVNVVVSITDVTINYSTVTLLPNEEKNLVVTITPSDATNKDVTWSSSNEEVVSVGSDGMVKALKSGTATITATVGGKTLTTEVKVLVPIEGVSISKTNMELVKGKSEKLTVTVIPEEAEESKLVTWKSSDERVATVSSDGTVTGVGRGTAVITGTLSNGMAVTSTVKVVVPATGIEVSEKLTVNKGESKKIAAKIIPGDSDDSLSFESLDESTATVDSEGNVTGVKKGTASIKVSAGSVTKYVEVTVYVPVTGVTLNKDKATLNRGETVRLEATINPEDASDRSVTWESDNPKVASVDGNGLVTALKKGTATITASAGGKSASFVVTVMVPITSFELKEGQDNALIVKNKTLELVTMIKPGADETTDNTMVTWESSNEEVATVDENGVVTGLKEGTAVITGTLENGMSVHSNVTVKIIPLIDIAMANDKVDLLKGESANLRIVLNPVDTTEASEITWTSSDEEVAVVDENGKVTALKEGTAVITASMNGFEASAEVNVTEVHLESMEVVNAKDSLEVGEEAKIEVKFNPLQVTDEITLTYESSDETVATVDENGMVTALKEGKTTIKVTASNGVETSFEYTVVAPSSPQTGVIPMTAFIIMSMSLLCLIVLVVRKEFLIKQIKREKVFCI